MPPRFPYDVVVVGLGLAGLVAGLAACSRGARTLLVGKGYGTLRFRAGTVDVLGYWQGRPVASPAAALDGLAAARPQHPYALAGRENLEAGLEAVRAAAAAAGLELAGGLAANRWVATAAGTLRPACLVPAGLDAEWEGASVLVVGLAGYRDFQSELPAGVLPGAAAALGIELEARALTVELPALRRRHLSGLELARLFEQPGFRSELANRLRPELGGISLVALPAVVGLEGAREAAGDLAGLLGLPVVELPTLPPSLPGLRLEHALAAALRRAGARLQVGTRVRAVAEGDRIGRLELEAPGRPLRLPVAAVVLAGGGFASGGLALDMEGTVRETVAGLPVAQPAGDEPFGRSFLEPGGHPASLAGVRVDRAMRPLEAAGGGLYRNLFVAGGLIAGADRAVEKSADGICCATGWQAGLGAAA